MEKTKEHIFLFNMSEKDINLQFEYNKDEIKLYYYQNVISSGQALKIEIKNLNIKNSSHLKINNKSITIKGLSLPNLKFNRTFASLNWISFDQIYQKKAYLKNFKLIEISKNFCIKNIEINAGFFTTYNIFDPFSVHLLYKNDIIKSYYNLNKFEAGTIKFLKEYEVYGFSDNEFGKFKYNDKDLKIILSINLNSSKFYESIFDDEKKN